MSENLKVSPEQLRATARDLADVSGRLKAVMSSLDVQLGAEGAAWGSDQLGTDFATGDQGYVRQVDWIKGSVDAKANLLDVYADGLKTTADKLGNV